MSTKHTSKKCSRCDAPLVADWNNGGTCRNPAACKRRTIKAAAPALMAACERYLEHLRLNGLSDPDAELAVTQARGEVVK